MLDSTDSGVSVNSNSTHLILRLAEIYKGSPYTKGGLFLLLLGGALLSTGWTIPMALWATGTPMSDAVQWGQPGTIQTIIGCTCLLAGIGLLLLAYRVDTKQPVPTVVAIIHQTFDGMARKLLPSDLPVSLRKAQIIHIPIDQSSHFKPGRGLDAKAALSQLIAIPPKILAHRQSHPDAVLAYAGKAHIPLVFWLAHRCFSELPIVSFELERSSGSWRHLPEDGHRLLVNSRIVGHVGTGDAVIKVEVSYHIADADVAAIVPAPEATATIAVVSPKLDCVTTRDDVEAIANQFRDVLDGFTGANIVHVFIAAPVSVVAALGRRVSPTIHPPVVVHNFTDNTVPRYAWGIHVNAKNGPKLVQNKELRGTASV